MTAMKHAILIFMAAASTLVVPAAAWAEDAPAPNPQAPAALGAAAVPDSELSNYRGGAEITNINDLNAGLYNNNALNSVTGGNFVTDGALAGSSGFSTLIQNSGNNVLIQNAMILNLQVQ
jgi:hypothetical protein